MVTATTQVASTQLVAGYGGGSYGGDYGSQTVATVLTATVEAPLKLARGDARDLTVRFSAALAAGDVIRFTAKRDLGDADVDAVIAKSTADGISFDAGGTVATVSLVPADTADLVDLVKLYYDVQLETAEGGGPWTVDQGVLLVVPDVTRTTGAPA